ncbi:MAG: methionyl-tRNA formyltransferase [Acidobacteria bacterium]|nr:methionyl-tRNA formyltransferase [Acidobacteriota bacterium]
MRIVFCGTPEFAVPSLRLLHSAPDIAVEAVITQPDRPRGRGQQVQSSPVKEFAIASRIHVYQPEKIRSDSAFEFFTKVAPDAVVIIAYGQIIPQRLIDIPRLGWINLHASLLPKYRGAAPVHWAIANGETQTGLTTMQVDAGLDTGPILLQSEIAIGENEFAPELMKRMAEVGAPLILETLRKLDKSEVHPAPQDHSAATLAPLLKKENGRIDWSQSASQIYNRIRGMQPWPGAFTTFRGRRCHIWGHPEASTAPDALRVFIPGQLRVQHDSICSACGNQTWLRLEFVQVEGRKRVSANEFANGAHLTTVDALS